MKTVKRMVRIPSSPGADEWTGPVLVRGWLRVRQPWRHPIAAGKLIVKWLRVKRDVDRAPAYRSFEYWLRLEWLVFGMHVGWASPSELDAFRAYPSHRDIARWATASTFVRAMKLETLAFDDGRVINLGGFYICEHESDIPPDSLFPLRVG